MKILELCSYIDRQPLTEAYVAEASQHVDEGLLRLFAEHRKLTGNLREDVAYLQNLTRLMEEDEDFDPFSHLVQTDQIIPAKDCVLTFSTTNDKLQELSITAFDLPAGYTCPFAKKCKAFAHKKGGKFASGKSIRQVGDIRCYATSSEAMYPNVRKHRWRNFDLLNEFKGDASGMADLIIRSMTYHEFRNPRIRVMRIHSSGDFFSQEYLDAWIKVAQKRNDVLFYAYTKALPFWKERKKSMPGNLRLIASEGGTHDELIDKEQFRRAVMVKDKGEAMRRKLRIDVNDFLAALGDEDFALLIHGGQKAGEMAKQSRANSRLIKQISQQFRVDPAEFERLLAFYISGARKTANAASRKRQKGLDEIVGGSQHGAGDDSTEYEEFVTPWEQPDKGYGWS